MVIQFSPASGGIPPQAGSSHFLRTIDYGKDCNGGIKNLFFPVREWFTDRNSGKYFFSKLLFEAGIHFIYQTAVALLYYLAFQLE